MSLDENEELQDLAESKPCPSCKQKKLAVYIPYCWDAMCCGNVIDVGCDHDSCTFSKTFNSQGDLRQWIETLERTEEQ